MGLEHVTLSIARGADAVTSSLILILHQSEVLLM